MKTNKVLYVLIAIVLVFFSLKILPIQFIDTKEKTDNPENCPYYVTLQASLANYKMLKTDQANVTFIQQRLVDFEKLIAVSESKLAVYRYFNEYKNIISKLGLSSIREARNSTMIIGAARAVAPIVDSFYLNKEVSCVNPLLSWKKDDHRRILHYNLGGLYDAIENVNRRILFSVDAGPQLGAFPGFIVNNQSTTLETQFMTGIPLLTALYVLPHYNFEKIGTYNGLVPWCAFSAEFVSDPVNRKLMNLAGVDIVTISANELIRKSSQFNIESLQEMSRIPATVYPMFDEGYKNYINLQSYGMAYLAKKIKYVKPDDIYPHEKRIKRFFAKPEKRSTSAFINATNAIYLQLNSLEGNGDILLESSNDSVGGQMPKEIASSGTAKIDGMVGERVAVTSLCEHEICKLVLNIAKAPGWRAFVNGQPEHIDRANFAFMAVSVPKGESITWFIYSALPNSLSYFLSALAMLIILVITFKQSLRP